MANEYLKELEERMSAAVDGLDGIDALNTLAFELLERDPGRAGSLAERALELARAEEQNGHPYIRGTAQALITLGELANNADAYGLALTRLFEAYSLLQGQLFPDLLALASHSIGWAHLRLGNEDEAVNFLNRSLALYRELGDKEKEAAVLTTLGSFYSETKDYTLAMENFQEALALQEVPPVNRSKGVTLNNLACTQIMVGASQDAVTNAIAGIHIFQELGLLVLKAKALDTLGQALLACGDTARAEEILQECLSVSKQIPSDHLEMQAMYTLAQAYRQQGRMDLACMHLQEAVRLAEKYHSNLYRYKFHEMLAEINEKQGNLKESLRHYKEFHTSMDLALAEATSYRMENLKIVHQVEKKRKEAEMLQLQNKALEREIDERMRERMELEKLATIDPLTGLYNRRHFFTLGEYELKKAFQEGSRLSVILLDIDHFKLVNDHFGHATGDQALLAAARLLLGNVRKGDICCRYGGEEFLILLPGAGLDAAKSVAEQVRWEMAFKPIWIDKNEIQMTASLGVVQAGPRDTDLTALLTQVDQALYRAKSAGRNQVST